MLSIVISPASVRARSAASVNARTPSIVVMRFMFKVSSPNPGTAVI